MLQLLWKDELRAPEKSSGLPVLSAYRSLSALKPEAPPEAAPDQTLCKCRFERA